MGAAIDQDAILDRLILCTACGHLRGPWRRPGRGADVLVQRCLCERDAGEESQPRWPGYDHNTVAELCRCCALTLVRSGSKWSVWFCGDCLSRVRALNQRAGRCVVPIGRHSLLNGIGLRAEPGRDDPDALAAYADQLDAFFAAAADTDGWRRQVIAENLDAVGLAFARAVPVRIYLERARQAGLSKDAAFARLLDAAADPGD